MDTAQFLTASSAVQSSDASVSVQASHDEARDTRNRRESGRQESDLLSNLERVAHRIEPGDTLGKLLDPFSRSAQERQSWVRAVRKQFSPRKLRPGREIYFYLDDRKSAPAQGKGQKQLKAVSLEPNDDSLLTWMVRDGEISFNRQEQPYEIEIKSIGGAITDSLYETSLRLGLSPQVVSQFVDIFGWDVNFQTDIKPGDSFRVLVERRYRAEGAQKELFRVLAAELATGKEKQFAFYFENGNGKGGYYDREGRSLTRSFLRYPLEFSRISSTFTHRRMHPILKIRRPHRGVDFAAPRNTPVRAIGDGRVEHAGWKRGGYGRFIEIQHGSTYTSRYAHLSGYARGIRRGNHVKKGQIIGYVGCSGSCTGPHLHFEIKKNQRLVNPLKVQLPREQKIAPPMQEDFEDAKQLVLTQLVSAARTTDRNHPQHVPSRADLNGGKPTGTDQAHVRQIQPTRDGEEA